MSPKSTDIKTHLLTSPVTLTENDSILRGGPTGRKVMGMCPGKGDLLFSS